MPNCKGPNCGKSIQYVSIGGKSVPVDINVRVIKVDMDAHGAFIGEDVNRDVNAGPVFGISHFLTCKDANMFSRSKTAPAETPDETRAAMDREFQAQLRRVDQVDQKAQASGEGAG